MAVLSLSRQLLVGRKEDEEAVAPLATDSAGDDTALPPRLRIGEGMPGEASTLLRERSGDTMAGLLVPAAAEAAAASLLPGAATVRLRSKRGCSCCCC
jgi:hypothetical protein